MTKKEQIYISLGSNQGDRLAYLTRALCYLEAFEIKIVGLSRVYETPPWGFESTPFYNACAQVQTDLSPPELMETLLRVENRMGRIRSSDGEYIARSIDLDLLCYEDVVMSSEQLTLPHPRLELRNFVLLPLEEISKGWIHPVLQKSISVLKQLCVDTAICKPFPFSFWSPQIFNNYPYIAIEGNIGVGKSTLSQKIGKQYSAKLLSEAFTNNPFLEAFYKNPKKYALDVETFFLRDRVRQMSQFWQDEKTVVVSDYSLNKSLIFASQNLTSNDFKIYQEEFFSINSELKRPAILVYIHANVSHILKQIEKRGRSFEQDIKEDYLRKIEDGYKNLIQTDLPFPVVSIAVDDLNFEQDEAAFQCVLRRIYETTFL